MLDILFILGGVLVFIVFSLCCCCMRCAVWACYDWWHPQQGSVIFLLMEEGYDF